MIEIRENPDFDHRQQSLLWMDGVLMENAYVSISPFEKYCDIGARDNETSKKIAAHTLSEFPLSLSYLYLHFYPDNIEHLDKKSGIFIRQDFTNSQGTNEFSIHLTLGDSSLTEWRSPYSFSEYAFELYKILKESNEVKEVNLTSGNDSYLTKERVIKDEDEEIPYYIDTELDEIDKSSISGLEISFPYTSPDVSIISEIERVSSIIRAAHEEAKSKLTPHIQNAPIEIRKVTGSEPNKYQLFVNGSIVEDAAVFANDDFTRKPFLSISLKTQQSLYRLGGSRFLDIPDNVSNVGIKLEADLLSKNERIVTESYLSIKTPRTDKNSFISVTENPAAFFNDSFLIKFYCSLYINNWTGNSSPQEYIDEINKVFSRNGDIYTDESTTNSEDRGFVVIVKVDSPNQMIVDGVFKCSDYLRQLFDKVEDNLNATSSSNSIVKSFNFPEEVGIACEQYLVYFVQFLRDLGVDATSELKHKAGQVLFTVTPANEEEALDKIRTALDVYLLLPASPVSNDMSNEIAIQRLESQVLRFQSDLRLAAAELQAKNATIEAQQLTISVQKALLNGEILLESMKDVTPKEKEEDREEFFDGTLALSVYKDKGVEVNWAKMFRQLKELFSKKGDK